MHPLYSFNGYQFVAILFLSMLPTHPSFLSGIILEQIPDIMKCHYHVH